METKLIIILLICLSMTSSVLSRSRGHKDKNRKVPNSTNICDSSRASVPITCYCTESKELNNATEAECWVFNGGLEQKDEIWAEFSTQKNLLKVAFIVRADGSLKHIPTIAIRHLEKLQNLGIVYANINEVTPYAFSNSTTIEELKLTRNKITILKRNSFAHLISLSVLNLDENRINEIGRDVFTDLPSLSKLYMRSNNVTVIHDSAFKDLSQLVELDLDLNSISVITGDSFKGLSKLKRLILSNNRIGFLGDYTFSELWSLQELLLETNGLQVITERAFDGLANLRKLYLNENSLTFLESGVLVGMPALTFLHLKDNQLQTLTHDNVRPIIDNLSNATSQFYISGNNFICDCRLSWMHKLRNVTHNDHVRNALDEVTCFLEPSTDVSIIDHLLQGDKSSRHNKNANKHQSASNTIAAKSLPEYKADGTSVKMAQTAASDEYSDDYVYEDDEPMNEGYQESVLDGTKMANDFQQHGAVVTLFKIPVDKLPCPEELRGPTEAPQTQEATDREGKHNHAGILRPATGIALCLFVICLW